jgi:glucose/arabinose dehydrogenase
MHISPRLFALCAILLAGFTALPVSAATDPALNGTLIRVDGDPKIYFVENGAKRWIDSWETFVAQGLRAEPVTTLSQNVFSSLPDGEPVRASSKILLAGEADVLPDVSPLAMKDLRFTTSNGRKVIKFSSLFWNQGKGKIELVADGVADAAGDSMIDTFQHLVRPNSRARDILVGNLLWHAIHGHYHYDNFANYVLEFERSIDGKPVKVPDTITSKTTFCLRDDVAITLKNGIALPREFGQCGKLRQGVSVGWADNYPWTLPDQLIDVQDLPAGIYRLSFVVDPLKRFLEQKQDNNESVVFLELNPAAGIAKVIASGAPFIAKDNTFPDGMLLKAEGDSKIYVVQKNRKRWLSSEEIFRSYGYSFANVYEVPKAVLGAISSQAFVKAKGGTTVYMVNDAGYKRRILNPAVLTSYGISGADVIEISAAEFSSHPDTNLIMRAGTNSVLSIETGLSVGTFGSFAVDEDQVQVVNDVDAEAYATNVVATGLFVPWDIAFLPDGDMLVTERNGQLRRLGAHPAVMPVSGVLTTGEGGLMGIALHPDFAANKYVYLYFTTSANDQENRVVRYKLNDNNTLTVDKTIISGIPSAIYHDGGQIAFGPDGMLYLTTGDANAPENAQYTSSLAGKTLRLTADGGIPSDNPFGTAVWSYGHRNAQGLAWDSAGRLWETEHGRSGAVSGYDELNLVEKGKNYGWPVIQGSETKVGMVSPVKQSTATYTWAPSGIAYTNGKLYWSGLRGSELYEVTVNANGTTSEVKKHLSGVYGRIRAVVLGPDGLLYITTSNRDGRGTVRTGDDKVIKVRPDFLK